MADPKAGSARAPAGLQRESLHCISMHHSPGAAVLGPCSSPSSSSVLKVLEMPGKAGSSATTEVFSRFEP